jgi:hypothetical protein
MKKTLKQLLCLFMVFQVLVMGTGFTVVQHFCPIKGKQTFIFSKPKCCPEKKNEEESSRNVHFKRTKCCKDHSEFYKITTESAGTFKVVLNALFLTLDNVFPSISIPVVHNVHLSTTLLPHILNIPPPLSGRSLLIHIQTFLI